MGIEEIKKLAIEHYDRMITWVEKQDLKEKTNYFKMEEEIRESWFAIDCLYCQRISIYECGGCPLCVLTRSLMCSCCNGIWHKMKLSQNWGEWLIYAKEVRKFIEENG